MDPKKTKLCKNRVVKNLIWRRTSAGKAGSRYDDVSFISRVVGWAVNSDGKVIGTKDSGETWTTLATIADVNNSAIYLRTVNFVNENVGYLGTLSAAMRLYKTEDGGVTWMPQTNLPKEAPLKICGFFAVNSKVLYATGTNNPDDGTAFIKSVDGGKTWTGRSLEEHAASLIDNYFFDELHGIVVGGATAVPKGTRIRSDLRPVILETRDGGDTWVNLLENFTHEYPQGEWGWKIDVVNEDVIYVALENLFDGAIAKTTDGGKTWTRLRINDEQGTANLEGIGFITENVGWVGGWGDWRTIMSIPSNSSGLSSFTANGGTRWTGANEIGKSINRFRFMGCPVNLGFASGEFIYKYAPFDSNSATITTGSDMDKASLIMFDSNARALSVPLSLKVAVRAGSKKLCVYVWDRFGTLVRVLAQEDNPRSGERIFVWDGNDTSGKRLTHGPYIFRARVDNESDSRVIAVNIPALDSYRIGY